MAWADTWAMGRAELQQAAGLVAIAAGAKQTLPGGLADGGAALGWFSLQYIPRIIPTHCKRLWGRDGLCPPMVFLSLQDDFPCKEARWEKGAAGLSKPCYWSKLQGRSSPSAGAAQPHWQHLTACEFGSFPKIPGPGTLWSPHVPSVAASGLRVCSCPMAHALGAFPSLWGCICELGGIWGY